MYEKEFERIIDASQKNALTFFVGAGVSALSGAPTWKNLIDSIYNELGKETKEKYDSDEFLRIPQIYYYSLNQNKRAYNKFVKSKIFSSSIIPNDIHREMLKLNPTSFITTNYDDLLVDAALQYGQNYKVIACDEDISKIYGDRFILKIHGDFKHNNIVLKEEDYLNYSENFKLTEAYVKSIFATNTVVFIGYGLNDYNIKLILNWTKTLLKKSFREPIFIYTGDKELTQEEIVYHSSRGLYVIDCNKISSNKGDYVDRYQAVFNEIKKASKLTLDGKNDNEAFDLLYNLLAPLDKLDALRVSDVSSRLYPYLYISENGVIHPKASSYKDLLLKKFLEVNRCSEEEMKNLPKDLLNKYSTILSVFSKAHICQIQDEQKWSSFINDDLPFADEKCIMFDYLTMHNFSKKHYNSYCMNYKKAFYLTQLKRYDEAFFLFAAVAKEAFKMNDSLLYYFAATNCLSLRIVLKNLNVYSRSYDLDAIDAAIPSNSEDLFKRLPIDFKNTYKNLDNLHSTDMLYKYSYSAFTDSQKVQRAIEANTVEFGQTSTETAICEINNYLHFLLGNGLITGIFNEYKNAVKSLMSALLLKYSTQDKNPLTERVFPLDLNQHLIFDNIDLYCLLECFESKDLLSVLQKYNINKIEFNNMNLIECAVKNILDYYEYLVNRKIKPIEQVEMSHLASKIKTCLILFRHVDISQDLVDKMCTFLLTYEQYDIRIDDKIYFFDYIIYQQKKHSAITAQTIENKLIFYIDSHLNAIAEEKDFSLLSTRGDINYYNLVNYINPENNRVSKRLSSRFSKSIKTNSPKLNKIIVQNYYNYLSKSQKKSLIANLKNALKSNFQYDIFADLICCNASIEDAILDQLKEYLRELILKNKTIASKEKIIAFPLQQPYEPLDNVGYWCFINVLNKEEFREFLGHSAKFDFFYEYDNFDFVKFKVSWLLELRKDALKLLASNDTVKAKIRSLILNELNTNKISDSDEKNLKNILIQYFCD